MAVKATTWYRTMARWQKCDGFNIVQNNGECAGQTVFHFHMHLIPRYESDDNKNVIEWNHKEFTDDEMKKICDEMSM